MALIADGLLIAATLVAVIYCHVLAGRLRKLRDLDNGLGAAVAALARQSEEMRRTLEAAKLASGDSVKQLAERTARAEIAAGRLELLLATLHERERTQPQPAARPRPARARPAKEAPAEAAAPEVAPREVARAETAAAEPEPSADPREGSRVEAPAASPGHAQASAERTAEPAEEPTVVFPEPPAAAKPAADRAGPAAPGRAPLERSRPGKTALASREEVIAALQREIEKALAAEGRR
ncbi:hypothetical protein [Oceanicella actignis]|uniref:Uncharacterized protein n=1 Tax=Oceanicella actignis TaxID=1189325 RepID=A0A1M7T687_9RHOB|nr:hypothetical protein [Oceanicella actignis]SET44512.1 hypothetical protein SAMN04488119_104234 [Oceanicella actignis]SHN66254.1 hypothetical protein SAMN05216200_104234 [Oceanicella actignis]